MTPPVCGPSMDFALLWEKVSVRHFTHSSRVLLAAWLAFMGLWPLQAAAYDVGARATAMCRMMPRMGSMARTGRMTTMLKRHHGATRGMHACRELQCRHRVGPRVTAAFFAPLVASGRFVMEPASRVLPSIHRVTRHSGRAPPSYLRFTRLLI